MANTADYQHYWGTVIDALALVYAYKKAGTDEFEYQIMDQEFPDAINRARKAYYCCDRFPVTPFGTVGSEIEELLHALVMEPKLLKRAYNQAFDNYKIAVPAEPLRIFLARIKKD